MIWLKLICQLYISIPEKVFKYQPDGQFNFYNNKLIEKDRKSVTLKDDLLTWLTQKDNNKEEKEHKKILSYKCYSQRWFPNEYWQTLNFYANKDWQIKKYV